MRQIQYNRKRGHIEMPYKKRNRAQQLLCDSIGIPSTLS